MGWSNLEALSKNHFILQSCSFLSGNDTIFFSQRVFLPNNASHRICLQSRALELICIPHPPLARGRKGGRELSLDSTALQEQYPKA